MSQLRASNSRIASLESQARTVRLVAVSLQQTPIRLRDDEWHRQWRNVISLLGEIQSDLSLERSTQSRIVNELSYEKYKISSLQHLNAMCPVCN
jgi:hypothetical protein